MKEISMEKSPDRISREREFHNARFGGGTDARRAVERWYAAMEPAQSRHRELVRRAARGGVALEYGCAEADYSLRGLRLQDIARRLHGIDISDRAIEKARLRATAIGVENATFSTMNAEEMTFPDSMFDVVFGCGIIHHLELGKAFPEIRRVLKRGGQAIFLEPLGHNRLINWYRRRTPQMRTADEHPLMKADFERARQFFDSVRLEFYALASLAAVPLARSFVGPFASHVLQAIDARLLALPGVRWSAWIVVMVME
jgi:ubiquinone/menaquinone biosynthesis C-methylase UbiE